MSIAQKISNWIIGEYAVRATRILADKALIQHVRLDVGVGDTESVVSTSIPISIVAPTTGLTPSAPGTVTIGTSDAQVVAANANRTGLIICNTSTSRVFLSINNTASSGRGIFLAPSSGVWTMDAFSFTRYEVRGIASAAGSVLSFQEFT